MPGSPSLRVELDTPLPAALAVGGGTALFVAGWCLPAAGRVAGLELLVDGLAAPVEAHSMPRLDVLRALHPTLDPFALRGVDEDPDAPEDPHLHSYRSGFWGMAVVPAGPRDAVRLALRARLDDGATAEAELGTVPVEALPDRVSVDAPAPEAGPLVAIAMATFDPPGELLTRQLDSIRAQTHANWVLVISDDGSRPDRWADLEAQVAGDPRIVLTRAPRRLGFFRNFERALALVPDAADFVAMADQDDRWDPDKLEVLLGAIGDRPLAYSDCRIVARDGQLLAPSYWTERRNDHEDLASVLVANSITGAASLLRRDLLDDALPFPPAQFAHFHDHWVGLVALALGDIAFVDRPLYDYVQHRDASLGHAAATSMATLGDRVAKLRHDPRERVRMWRLHFFVDVARIRQLATVLELRVGDRMDRAKRRRLRRILAADRSTASLAWLGARGVRELLGRGRPTTLGAEYMLASALAWRRLLSASTRDRPVRGLRLDAVPPASFVQAPGRSAPLTPELRVVAEKIEPLGLALDRAEPARVNVLIPTIDLDHFFGGYIAKLNLAARLAARGLRVRLVTTDPVGPLPADWQTQLEAYSGLAGVFGAVEVAFGREAAPLAVSPQDRFVATTWWTAHLADAAVKALGGGPFTYLVQEHEPLTFPSGSLAALAEQSYRFEHRALFSTELLRTYFRRQGLGVFAAGSGPGDERSASFQNAITDVGTPDAARLAQRRPRRLLFYARPEPHAARNLFELGVLALRRALEDGAFRGAWELRGIGTVRLGRRMALGGGAELELLPRTGQAAYAEVLREHDVGLSLMHTPHPSLVPIEMASAGMLTVTSTYATKDAAALRAISPNLLGAEPTVEAVAGALHEAAAGVEDVERRVAGSAVAWARDWDTALGDELLGRVAGWLAG